MRIESSNKRILLHSSEQIARSEYKHRGYSRDF